MLTPSELEIMNLLWDSEKALTSSQIVDQCPDRTWKESYIHILINSLLKKDMIKVSGFTRTTKNFARTFEPTCSRIEYVFEEYQVLINLYQVLFKVRVMLWYHNLYNTLVRIRNKRNASH